MGNKRPWQKGQQGRKREIVCRRCKLRSLVWFGDICEDCVSVEARLYVLH